MKNLLNFLIRHISWFLFIIYVILSLIMLFSSNSYQRHVYLTSANSLSAWVYGHVSKITSYFGLREINEDLHQSNAELLDEINILRNEVKRLHMLTDNDSLSWVKIPSDFKFSRASVIDNSISHPYNYITIDKGSADSIESEMGVVDQNGVVGIVEVAGEHASRIISLLNPNFRLSCKIKNQDHFGSLVWDGKDPRYAILEEMPRHVKFKRGDTIITSGYSAVFPEGLIVGTVEGSVRSNNDNFNTLKVKLSTDLSKLSTVRVLKSMKRDEIKTLNSEKQ